MRTLRLRSTLRCALIPVLALAPMIGCRGGDDGNTTGSGGDTSSSSGKMTSSSSSSSSKASSSSGMTTNSSSGVVSSSADASSSTGMGGMGGMGGAGSTSVASTTAASTTASSTAMASSSTGVPTTETNCSDGLDDDMGGGIDCADTDCDTAPACSSIIINEINYDNPGPGDAAEFVEIYNPGPNATNLDGVALLLVNGNTNPAPAVYSPSTDLSGLTLQPGQYLVVGTTGLMVAAGAIKVDFVGTTNIVQNGALGIAAPGDAVALFDNNEKVLLDALSYEAPVLNATIGGMSYDLYEGPMPFPALIAGESDLAPEASIIRFPNGVDSGNDNVDFRTTGLITPGAANVAQEICNDTADNDGDMAIDCADSDCTTAPNCMEDCDDGVDNNANMQIDCAEASCNAMMCGPNGLICASMACACPSGNMENCTDGMDNDCDGLNNCADPDCSSAPACSEICNDGMDNNGNSLVDCQEMTCDGQGCGTFGKTCITGMCSCAGGMTETACGDVADNDCDGMVDCMDSDCTGTPACMMPTGGLLFSEYVEGSSNNKAVEIKNNTGAAFDMTANACKLEQYANGAMMPTSTITLTATIQPNDVWVVCNANAGAGLLALCDQTTPASGSTSLNFNGDDAVRLSCGTTTYDIIGQIGSDPGTQWGTGNNSTLDHTLRRKCSVTAGDTDGSDAFDPVAALWLGLGIDTFAGLGDPACAP